MLEKLNIEETKKSLNNENPKPIIDSIDRADDLKNEDIEEIREQMDILINLKKRDTN